MLIKRFVLGPGEGRVGAETGDGNDAALELAAYE